MAAKKPKLASTCSNVSVESTDWTMCVICQENTGAALVSPTDVGYNTLATNLQDFHDLQRLPANLCLKRLDNSSGIADTLKTNQAKWHKNCYSTLNAAKVVRLPKLAKAKEEISGPSPVKTRLSLGGPAAFPQHSCLFCCKCNGDLHRIETMEFDRSLRSMATDRRDTQVLARLSGSDAIAQELAYHKSCYTSFYTRHRALARQTASATDEESQQTYAESLSMAKLAAYIEVTAIFNKDTAPAFKLSELKKIYIEQLEEQGAEYCKPVHSTRFKEQLLERVPELQSHTRQAGNVFTFKADSGDAILRACKFEENSTDYMLIELAKLIRKEIFERSYSFKGSLHDDSYQNLPPTLCKLVKSPIESSPYWHMTKFTNN
jgi:hypothetical protein